MARIVTATFLFFFSSRSFASFDVPLIHCKPASAEGTVKAKTLHWKKAIEDKWCKGKRTARYVLVVNCSEGQKDEAHLTTFTFLGPGVIDKAKVDVDLRRADVLDRGLPHGLVHAIVPSCLPAHLPLLDLPHWIMEGMAQTFVLGLYDDARELFGKSPDALRPLEKLLFEESRELAFRTQSGLLVDYLVEKLGGAENFKQFVVALGFGDEPPPALSLAHLAAYGRAFQKHYGMTVSELDAAFRKHVNSVVAP